LANERHYRTDYNSRNITTLSKRKVVDLSNAVPIAAHLVERRFCQADASAMASFVAIPKRPGVQKKTSTFVPKCEDSVSRRLREYRGDFPSLVGFGRPASVRLERLLGVLVES
jgi:hypothetical protein